MFLSFDQVGEQFGGARTRGTRNVIQARAYDPIKSRSKETFSDFVKFVDSASSQKNLNKIRNEIQSINSLTKDTGITAKHVKLWRSFERPVDRTKYNPKKLSETDMQTMIMIQRRLPKNKYVSPTLLKLLQNYGPGLFEKGKSGKAACTTGSAASCFKMFVEFWMMSATDAMANKYSEDWNGEPGTLLDVVNDETILSAIVKIYDALITSINTKAQRLTDLKQILATFQPKLHEKFGSIVQLAPFEKKLRDRLSKKTLAFRNRDQVQINYDRIVQIFENKTESYQNMKNKTPIFDRIMLVQLMTGSRLNEVLTLTQFSPVNTAAYKSAKSMNMGEKNTGPVECKIQATKKGEGRGKAKQYGPATRASKRRKVKPMKLRDSESDDENEPTRRKSKPKDKRVDDESVTKRRKVASSKVSEEEPTDESDDESSEDEGDEDDDLIQNRRALDKDEMITISRLAKKMTKAQKQAARASGEEFDSSIYFSEAARHVPIWVPHHYDKNGHDQERYWTASRISELVSGIRKTLEKDYNIPIQKPQVKRFALDAPWRRYVKQRFNYGPYNNYLKTLWGRALNLTSHKMRALYGNLTYDAYAPSRRSRQYWLSQVLGHSGEDMSAATFYTNLSINYGVKSYGEPKYWLQLKNLELQMQKIQRGGVPSEEIKSAPMQRSETVEIAFVTDTPDKPKKSGQKRTISIQRNGRGSKARKIEDVEAEIYKKLGKFLPGDKIRRLMTWRMFKRLGFGSSAISAFRKS